MRKLINLCGQILSSSNYLQRLLLSIQDDSFRIVYFHMVTPDPHDCPYYFKSGITPEAFKKIITFLNNEYRIIPLSEAIEMNNKGASLKNCLSITTDDGFKENYDYVAPILLDLKLSATFFLIDECIDNANLMWRNKIIYLQNKIDLQRLYKLMENLAKEKNIDLPKKNENLLAWSGRTWDMHKIDIWINELWEKTRLEPVAEFLEKYKPYMTLEQIKELLSKGFEIGAHSKSHPFFNKLDVDQAENELEGSLDNISKKIGKQVYLFSYPFGPRALPQIEKDLIVKHADKIKALLGIKNSLNNFDNPHCWERDLIERPYNEALLRFLLLPVVRRKLFIPLGIKR